MPFSQVAQSHVTASPGPARRGDRAETFAQLAPAQQSIFACTYHEEVVDREPRTWVVDASAVNALVGHSGLSPELLARLTCGLSARSRQAVPLGSLRFLHLVFTNGAKQLSIFLAPFGAPLPFGIQPRTCRPLVRRGRLEALIVTDQSADAPQFARAVASVM